MLRHRLRQARRGAWYALAIALVMMALVAGVVSQLLPLAERHPDRIAAWLGARAQRTVRFDHVSTEWTRRGPLLRLDGLRIGDGAETVPIGAAEILVSQYAGLLPGRSFTELRLRGLALTLQREDDGRWRVRGLPGQAQPAGDDPFAALQGLGELQVIGGSLGIVAPGLGIDARLPKVDLRLRVDGDRVRIGTRAWMRAGVSPVQGVLDFDRRLGNGRVYVAAKRADLSAWSPLLHLAGAQVAAGSGRLEAWAELRDRRIQRVAVEARLQQLRLRGAPLPTKARAGAVPEVALGRVDARLRWQAVAGGWRLQASRLRIGAGPAIQTLDGLLLAGGRRYGLLARRIDAGPLFAVAALSDRLDPGVRSWLHAARPDAVLHDVRIAGLRGGALRTHARIDNLRFAARADAPGISGLGGVVDGDGQGFAFIPDAGALLRFDWPRGFGAPHEVRLRGGIAGWRDGAGWQVATPALRIDGIGYGAQVRGGLGFDGDGTRPRIDLAVDLDQARVPTAKRFWVRHAMSPATVHWLDTALLGGRVANGRAVVSGDLDDWPFRAEAGAPAKGLFQADARLLDAMVKFHPDWPAAEHVDGDVRFIADGFTLTGKAVIAGIAVSKLDAGIAHFGAADLQVRAAAAADAARLLALLRQSPLQAGQGEALRHVSASGAATVAMALALPLHAPQRQPRLDGSVELHGAKLADSQWQLAFERVNGKLAFDHRGFAANALDASQAGQAGKLSLRAGAGHVRDRQQAFEADLQLMLPVDALLAHAPGLAWLKPYAQGRSAWTVNVAIAAAASPSPTTTPAPKQSSARLQLRSDLVGTRLDLPAPLDKAVAAALPISIDTSLPFERSEMTIAFGQRLALRARSGNGQTGVRVVLGSDRVDDAPPASGLVASGHAAALDALGWIAMTADSGGKGSAGLALRRVDISTARLQLLGSSFADARLRAAPVAGGTTLRIDGPALSGSLLLPQANGAAIVGSFERVYWRAAPAPAAIRADAANTAVDDAPDPAKIPPLNLVVDDLRVGDAVLGSTVLRTRPTSGGLHVEQLQARAKKQRIDITGNWVGRGRSARTALKADVASDDFGALLSGFGFGGRLLGSHGEAHLDAAWSGAPTAFQPASLEGTLSLVMKDGQLAELNPGAGRVLGLLSVAELPRRLMLDFRDLFAKGFSFNRIAGNVRFGAGQARSDDLAIDGPAAQIRIRGAADLRAQTFNQTIEVLPKSGNLLTVAGAIAGGPVGAAVGAVANAVLKKPLGALGAKTYRVTGPWHAPNVDVVKRAQAPAAPEDARQPRR